MNEEPVPQFVMDLGYWRVALRGGESAFLRAHGFSERGDWYVFVALMEGTPPYEYELARFPAAVVEDVFGGWSEIGPDDTAED